MPGTRAERRREFLLTEDEDRSLVLAAAVAGVPVATLIREAVNEYVADYAERVPFVSSGGNSASVVTSSS